MAVDRRDFLKAASLSLAAGAAAFPEVISGQSPRPGAVNISGTPYQHRPGRDYPIRAQGFADVRLTDEFWKPKVDLNAAVTIPLEVHKFVDGEREFGGNILEAAIMSLKTHPDPGLQALVDAQIRTTSRADAETMASKSPRPISR